MAYADPVTPPWVDEATRVMEPKRPRQRRIPPVAALTARRMTPRSRMA